MPKKNSMQKLKSFGQHFLRNDHIARRIVEQLQIDEQTGGTVVEIGPGEGVLTQHLLERPDIAQFFAVELDRRLPEILMARYPRLENCIINEDVLRVAFERFAGDRFSVIGNFPYNISTQILFKILDYRTHVPQMVGMFQREVAQRIAAPPGGKDYGVTSVLLQAYYQTKYCFTVEAGNFDPPPKVQSGVIRLRRSHAHDATIKHHEHLRSVVKSAFGQRRKMLRNALQSLPIDDTQLPTNIWTKRAEQLSVAEFIAIANAWQPTQGMLGE